MKYLFFCWLIFLILTGFYSCQKPTPNPFWDDKPFFEKEEIFKGGRFPNVVISMDGSIITTWGRDSFRVRRSEDGGETWGKEILIAKPAIQGGGAIVDENTGDILVFEEEEHPPAPMTMHRSTDHGKTWKAEGIKIYPDETGNIPSMCMNEHGITLKHGEHAGRLIRPTRYYAGGNERSEWPNHYTNAIYSDDHGKTWHTSAPFPAKGTGEAAIAELSDGSIYYNSRRHLSTDGRNPRMRHIAWSYDGGATWEDLSVSEILPDGAQHRDYGLMGGLVRLPLENHDVLIFSNIDSEKGRKRGTIWASFDGGKTWPVKRLVEEGSFAYSSMAAGREGTPSEGLIYLQYESENGCKLARFNLNWVARGKEWREFLPD